MLYSSDDNEHFSVFYVAGPAVHVALIVYRLPFSQPMIVTVHHFECVLFFLFPLDDDPACGRTDKDDRDRLTPTCSLF